MSRIALLGSILFAAACARPTEEAPSAPVAAPVAKPLFEIEFSNLLSFPDEGPPKPGQAYVTIRKNDPDYGWVVWKKIQVEGERLGWVREDGKPTSLHRVFCSKLGKVVKVDFDTKALLKKVTTGKLVIYESRHCPILKKAMLKCPGPISVEASYKVDEAIYVTETGTPVVFSKPSGPGPKLDSLCPAHGGMGDLQTWSEEELKAVRAEEAEFLFSEAAEGRLSRNPKLRKQARDAYRRLLKEFPSEAVVSKNLDLIKARAEAEIED